MFRLENREVHEVFVADSAGNSVVEFLVGRKPIGTCGDVCQQHLSFAATGYAHPIGSLGERLDHQILIFLSPFSHPHIRANDGAGIVNDVFRLPSLIVKRHAMVSQRLYHGADIDFGTTGDTYTEMREGKSDKLLHEIKNYFPWSWHTKSVRAFIECVHNDVRWVIIGQCEYLLKAFYQDIIGGLVGAVVVSHVNAMENIAAKIGAIRKLRKEGKDQVSAILFLSIPEVEVIVSHRSQSSLAQSHDFLDDRRASRQFRSREKETHEEERTKARFSRILL